MKIHILSFLQKMYRKFFYALLEKFGVKSPQELDDDTRRVFFIQVEEEWRKEKEKLIKEIEVETPVSEKESYAKLKVSRPAIAIEPELESRSAEAQEVLAEEINDKEEVEQIDHKDLVGGAVPKTTSPISLAQEPESEYINPEESDVQEVKIHLVGENEKKGANKLEEGSEAKLKLPVRNGKTSKVPLGKENPSLGKTTKIKRKKQIKSSPVVKDEDGVEIIRSQENPEQGDDLRINYHPNHFFAQGAKYTYPVVKMPKEGALLKLPRKGRAMGKGYAESAFYQAIVNGVADVEAVNDLHMAIPHYNRPYEPDIALINRELNLYVDIEVDEPYDGYYRFPTHNYIQDEKTEAIVKKDDTRDLFFNESGWMVIRFTERQVHTQQQQCIGYINDVLNSIISYRLEVTSTCIAESQWSYQQAVKWEKDHYREKYLELDRFDKQICTSRLLVDVNTIEGIETSIDRTEKTGTITLQDNVAFEDETHVYHHAKDRTGNAEYISVTTLIDRFFPFDMDRFITNKATREERSEQEVLEEFLKIRDEASEKGTYLHEQIEYFLKGKAHDANLKEFKMFKVFYKEIVEAKGFEFVEAEKSVLLDDYNVAGTIDALFKKPGKEEYLIIDWKRSKKLLVDGHPKKYGFGYGLSELSHLDNSSYYKYALQQNLYKYMLEKKCGMKVSTMNLIVLHEKFGRYHRVNLENMDREVSIILRSINHKI